MRDYYLKILAENLKKFRIEHGYSRKELATIVGVTSSYIGQIENAKNLKAVLRHLLVTLTCANLLTSHKRYSIVCSAECCLIRHSNVSLTFLIAKHSRTEYKIAQLYQIKVQNFLEQ